MTTKNTQSYHTGNNCSIQKTGFTNSFTREHGQSLPPFREGSANADF